MEQQSPAHALALAGLWFARNAGLSGSFLLWCLADSAQRHLGPFAFFAAGERVYLVGDNTL
jgi:hypothetical protein